MTPSSARRTGTIRVVVVEDSPTVSRLLVRILSRDPAISVVGTAEDGQAAIDLIASTRPDVVTMDVNMPGLDGLEATRRIMANCPVPIIIVSASTRPEEVELTFKALEAGAVAVLEKPYAPGTPEHDRMANRLRQMVRLMSEVKVVQRRFPASGGWKNFPVPPGSPVRETRSPVIPLPQAPGCDLAVVAIGASTGGPPALRELLEGLPAGFPAALLVVQHIAPGFLEGMVHWLSQSTALELRVASPGDQLRPGLALFAPNGLHLGLETGERVVLSSDPPLHGVRPSVSHLFRSVAGRCGSRAAGILLTGMGRDGAAELGMIRKAGGFTIAQDEATSVVHGMPGEAVRLGAAASILPPSAIPEALISWLGQN